MSRAPLILLLVALGSCRSPDRASPEPATPVREFVREREAMPSLTASRDGVGDAVVVKVGGAEIRRSDVGDFAMRYFRDQANEAITHLVDETILDAEAKEHDIEVPADLLARAVEAEVSDFARKVKVQFGATTSIEEYLRDRYGLTPEEHRKDLMRLVRVQLLRDRVIRFSALREDRVEVREAVFADEAGARRASEGARAGADLGTLAERGGVRAATVLPPVPRDEISPPDLADAVFGLRDGEVSDAIIVTSDGRRQWHVYKMVRHLPARSGSFADLRAEIERGLLEKAVEPFEYKMWARKARVVYRLEIP